MFLLALCALIFGASAFGQTRVLTYPIYDNLNTYSSGNYTPLVWNNTTHAMEKQDTLHVYYYNPFLLYTLTGAGYSTIYSRTNKTVAYIGTGNNKSGAISLYDTLGTNYYRVHDTLSAWSINSYKAQEYKIRGKRLIRFDTTKVISFDTAVAFNGTVTLSGTTAATTLSATSVDINTVKVRTGTGSPEGVITAPVGSMYLRTDGSTTLTVFYVKTSGSGNTGWTGK